MTLSIWISRQNMVIVRLLVLVCLIILFGIGLQATLAADDYCHYLGTLNNGVLGELATRYNGWSGRWAQELSTAVIFTIFGEATPQIMPGLFITGMIGALAFALGWKRNLLVISGLLILAYIGLLDTFAFQSVYWLAGSVSYLPPLIGGALLWGLIDRRAPLPLIFIVSGITSGFHETTGVTLVVVFALFQLRSRLPQAAIAIIGLLLGTTIVLIAPGNAVRAAAVATSQDLPTAAFNALVGTFANLTRVLLTAPLPAIACVVMGAALFGADARRPHRLILALIIGFGIGTINLLPAAYRLGGLAPPRFYVLPTAALSVALVMIGSSLPRVRWSRALTVCALLVTLQVGSLYVTATRVTSQPNGFALLAGIDTPLTANWVMTCATAIRE